MSGVPSVSLSAANHPGHRSNEHDSKRTGQVDSEGRHCWTGRVRWTPVGVDDGVIARAISSHHVSVFRIATLPEIQRFVTTDEHYFADVPTLDGSG